MSTTARPPQGQPSGRTPRVLRVAGVCAAVAVSLASVTGVVVNGSAAGLGALVGGGIVTGFLVSGSAVVNAAVRMAPQAAMVVAMMTYTLQVVLVLIVFIALSESGLVGDRLASGWVAGGVIAAALSWTVGQLVASARARIPAYDIELPGSAGPSVQVLSRSREVGAP